MHRISVIDTHTGGEPTRVVLDGVPDLGKGTMAERARRFGVEFDQVRSTIVNEPRGSDVLVGALLCEPKDSANAAGVIFFNNVGVLGMCGHGTIGVAVALHHAGMISTGKHVIETSVGNVEFELDAHGESVTLENVPSYRHAKNVEVQTDEGIVIGDIAWGGNWFFLVGEHGQELCANRVEELTRYTKMIRRGLQQQQITGTDGGEIDHIELFAPSNGPADSKNFVLCPGGAYDRSPCGTGTSAKVACLAADGKLQPGEEWLQESIIGSSFVASYREANPSERETMGLADVESTDTKLIIPCITGSAWICGENTLLVNQQDPFRYGFRND